MNRLVLLKISYKTYNNRFRITFILSLISDILGDNEHNGNTYLSRNSFVLLLTQFIHGRILVSKVDSVF